MSISIFLQSVLDGLLLSLLNLGLLGRSRGKLDRLIPLLFTGVCLLSRLGPRHRHGICCAPGRSNRIVSVFFPRRAVIKQFVVSKERGTYAFRYGCRLCAVSPAEGTLLIVPGPVQSGGASVVSLCGPGAVPRPMAGALGHGGAPVAAGEALGWGSSHLYGLQQYGPAAFAAAPPVPV